MLHTRYLSFLGFMMDINFVFKGEDIPVSFAYEGEQYKGFLSWVTGAGGFGEVLIAWYQ